MNIGFLLVLKLMVMTTNVICEYLETKSDDTTSDKKGKPKGFEGFIVGGQDAKIENFPHSVFVVIDCNGRMTNCGGSIINQKLVLTAGHCPYRCREDTSFLIDLYVGSETPLTSETQMRKVRKFLVHAEFDPFTFNCDIALLYVGGELLLDWNVKRVLLKNQLPTTWPIKARVAGWGVTDEEGTYTKQLQYTDQWVLPQTECSSIESFHQGNICAYGNGSYPYKGDSGSALITSSFYQIGLVSFRSDKNKTVIVYTNTAYFYDWIRERCVKLYCSS